MEHSHAHSFTSLGLTICKGKQLQQKIDSRQSPQILAVWLITEKVCGSLYYKFYSKMTYVPIVLMLEDQKRCFIIKSIKSLSIRHKSPATLQQMMPLIIFIWNLFSPYILNSKGRLKKQLLIKKDDRHFLLLCQQHFKRIFLKELGLNLA